MSSSKLVQVDRKTVPNYQLNFNVTVFHSLITANITIMVILLISVGSNTQKLVFG